MPNDARVDSMPSGVHEGKSLRDIPSAYLQGVVRYWPKELDEDFAVAKAAHSELWRRVRGGDWRLQVPPLER